MSVLLLALLAADAEPHAVTRQKGTVKLIVWTTDDAGATQACEAAFAEIDRVDGVLSEWKPDSEISRINKAAGGEAVSISPETELNMGMGRLALGKCRAFGIRPTLSCDIVSLNSGDLFSQMRLALAYQRFADNDPINQRGAMPQTLACSARDALRWATCNGADACGLESQIGSLRPGKAADIIVVGGDSFAGRPRHDAAGSVVFQATSQDVSYVLVAGRAVKRDGSLVGVDLGRTLARAEQSAEAVLARVRQTTPVLPPKPLPGVDLEAMARHNLESH